MPNTFGVKNPWPVGVWIRLSDPKYANAAWFTYIDPDMGLNAATDHFIGLNASPAFVVARWPQNWTTGELMTAAEIAELALPARPKWLESYGPQPPPGTLWGTWRNDPRLQGRFHPDYPDDIQVMVHDGGPRLTNHRPEVIWVRVIEQENIAYRGIALNQPQQLESVKQNSRIKFIVPSGGTLPLMVTEKYLAERADWIIYPCNKCGFSEAFDAPSDLHKAIFPETREMEVPVSFTSRCVQCEEGFQLLHNKAFPADPELPMNEGAGQAPANTEAHPPAGRDALTITARDVSDVVILDLMGEYLRTSTGKPYLPEHIKFHLERGKRKFIVNLEKLDLIDSFGVSDILASFLAAFKANARLKVAALPRRFKKIIPPEPQPVPGLLYPTVEEALAALQEPWPQK